MKKLLVIAVALAAVNAEATRARVQALGNSPHVIDVQTVYTNPSDVFSLGGDYVTLESGATPALGGNAQNANAEGMVVRTMGDSKLGLSLGHQSKNASTWGLRAAAAAAGMSADQQNPVEFTYATKSGDMAWGATLVYSNYKNKLAAGNTVETESSMGVRAGARAGNWEASVGLGLSNEVKQADGDKFTGTLGLSAQGEYQMDSVLLFANYVNAGAKVEIASAEVAKVSSTEMTIGAMTSIKRDGSEIFYGASIAQTETKETVTDDKSTTMKMPLWIGVEADANSWLTLRGTITQSLQLMNNEKVVTNGADTAEFSPADSDTTVAFGAGVKFNKVTVDGTILAGTQTYGTNNLLGQVGFTYMF
jgi:hypothetical protein